MNKPFYALKILNPEYTRGYLLGHPSDFDCDVTDDIESATSFTFPEVVELREAGGERFHKNVEVILLGFED